jgi:hypothetical protein
MLNSGKKIRALRDKKKIRTLVLSEKKFLNETKNHNPPPPSNLNGRSFISWRSVLLVEQTGVPGGKKPTWRKSLTAFIT